MQFLFHFNYDFATTFSLAMVFSGTVVDGALWNAIILVVKTRSM